jgi:hypothetical protein
MHGPCVHGKACESSQRACALLGGSGVNRSPVVRPTQVAALLLPPIAFPVMGGSRSLSRSTRD